MAAGLTAAETILKRLGIVDPAEIDLEAIAWTQGARVRYRPLDGCEARIIGKGDKAIISVDSRSSRRRMRFSLAHELGHWHHHRGRIAECQPEDIGVGGNARLATERAADDFAADMLMPNHLFEPVARSYPKFDFKTVRCIADAFDCSLTATAIRLIEHRHTPAVLVCHGPQGRKWFCRSRDVPDHWFPRDSLDPASFAHGVLVESRPDDRTPRKIGADAWFGRFDADRYELEEQTVRTGADEILSLILIRDDAMLEESADGSAWRRSR